MKSTLCNGGHHQMCEQKNYSTWCTCQCHSQQKKIVEEDILEYPTELDTCNKDVYALD